jgi:hypothetical protein
MSLGTPSGAQKGPGETHSSSQLCTVQSEVQSEVRSQRAKAGYSFTSLRSCAVHK